ncbi:MAG: alpha/beta hydrolase [Anaerolineae bacterium]|nr:alpha/beta hydrolase [Anaerolineae bacterium]
MLSHWTQSDLIVNGVQIHYYRTGKGDKRPLVLVHGFSDNGLCWSPVARQLESEYDVIMPDMRGHGLSARLQPGEKVDMAADLAGLIRTLALGSPLICGHSMGAMITYQIGVRFPELASALVLEDPPWWFPQPQVVQPPQSDESAEPPIAKWARSLAHQTFDELLAQNRLDHPDWPDELLLPMCESKKQLDPAIVDTMVKRMNAQEVNWLTSIENVKHPVLLVVGNAELGGIVTAEVVAKVKQLNPQVNITVISDVGHLIRFDKPGEFMNTLRSFLKRLS